MGGNELEECEQLFSVYMFMGLQPNHQRYESGERLHHQKKCVSAASPAGIGNPDRKMFWAP